MFLSEVIPGPGLQWEGLAGSMAGTCKLTTLSGLLYLSQISANTSLEGGALKVFSMNWANQESTGSPTLESATICYTKPQKGLSTLGCWSTSLGEGVSFNSSSESLIWCSPHALRHFLIFGTMQRNLPVRGRIRVSSPGPGRTSRVRIRSSPRSTTPGTSPVTLVSATGMSVPAAASTSWRRHEAALFSAMGPAEWKRMTMFPINTTVFIFKGINILPHPKDEVRKFMFLGGPSLEW